MMEMKELKTGWQLRRIDSREALTPEEAQQWSDDIDEKWLDIPTMPMQVHDVLAGAGKLPRPGEMGSAETGKWVAEHDWLYRLPLTALPDGEYVDLHCEGIDTIADVWCNGTLVAEHRNCYLPLQCRLDPHLRRDGSDVLLIHFQAPEAWAEKHLKPLLSEQDRAAGVTELEMLRKPRQDFGTFLGPRFTPVGIFAPVEMSGHNGHTIDACSILSDLDDRSDKGKVTIELQGRSLAKADLKARCRLFDADENVISETTAKIENKSETWQFVIEMTIDSPRRWMPKHLGTPYLYTFVLELLQDGEIVQTCSRKTGFRNLQHLGDFNFLINGQPLRFWGVNLPPLQPGHVWNHQKACRMLDMAELANSNTIRIWGPGQPFNNHHLLEEADRRGLMVWFEFPNEFHPHPENPHHIKNCCEEAAHYVRTFRHHPSIFLWSGGNEGYLTLDPAFAGEDALRANTGMPLFDAAYRDVCHRLDPARLYVPQSPAGGSYANSPLQGDTHCYNDLVINPGIGWPKMATEHFRYTVPRPWSIRRWLGDDAWPEGFVSRLKDNHSGRLIPETWRKICTAGTLGTYMFGPLGDFYETGDTLEGLVDKMDAASMKYIRRTVERFRRGRSRHDTTGLRHTRGHLWWKLQDTWPKLRNALIDADGEPSGSFYALQRAHAPILLSFEIDEDDRLWLWAVNDTPETIRGDIHIERRDEMGVQVLQEYKAKVQLDPDQSKPLADLSIWGSFFRNTVLAAWLHDEKGKEQAFTTDVVAPEICCTIQDPKLIARQEENIIRLRCEKVARRVTITTGSHADAPRGLVLEDNYFDLLPAVEKHVRILQAPPDTQLYVRWAGQYSDQILK